jgi:hypothetical protein
MPRPHLWPTVPGTARIPGRTRAESNSRVGWSRIAVRPGRLARGTRDWTGSDHVAMYCCYLSHSRSPRKYYLQESVARLEKD